MTQKTFSILIPTWNCLPYLKMCVESIRKNSRYQHQIIVHVNEGTDGTLEWIKSEGIDHTYSKENVGVCIAMNMMRSLVETQYMLFVNDDMYLLPGWDELLLKEINALGDNKRFYLSLSVVQPHSAPGRGTGILRNYGDSPHNFRETDLLHDCRDFKIPDWQGATRPPSIVHRDIWDMVGGYSIELSPGMGSDPDFTAKLLLVGCRYMKGLGNAWAYHFESKSTVKVQKNNYVAQFLLKWGLLNSTMRKHVTRLGQPWDQRDTPRRSVKAELVRAYLKAIFYVVARKHGTTKKIWEW